MVLPELIIPFVPEGEFLIWALICKEYYNHLKKIEYPKFTYISSVARGPSLLNYFWDIKNCNLSGAETVEIYVSNVIKTIPIEELWAIVGGHALNNGVLPGEEWAEVADKYIKYILFENRPMRLLYKYYVFHSPEGEMFPEWDFIKYSIQSGMCDTIFITANILNLDLCKNVMIGAWMYRIISRKVSGDETYYTGVVIDEFVMMQSSFGSFVFDRLY